MSVTLDKNTFAIGDHVTLTRTPAGVGNPTTARYAGTLTQLVRSHGRLSGGTIQTPTGPVTLDLDAERMQRLYGVTQTLTKGA